MDKGTGTTGIDGELPAPVPPANQEGFRSSDSLGTPDCHAKGYLELVQSCFRLSYDYYHHRDAELQPGSATTTLGYCDTTMLLMLYDTIALMYRCTECTDAY